MNKWKAAKICCVIGAIILVAVIYEALVAPPAPYGCSAFSIYYDATHRDTKVTSQSRVIWFSMDELQSFPAPTTLYVGKLQFTGNDTLVICTLHQDHCYRLIGDQNTSGMYETLYDGTILLFPCELPST